MSSNSKFCLYVSDKTNPYFGRCLQARVFGSNSLRALVDSIEAGVFGHYSKKRYYLVPTGHLRSCGIDGFPPRSELEAELQLFPNGGKTINPKVLYWVTAYTSDNKK